MNTFEQFLKIKSDKVFGRYFTATKHIKKGEIIKTELSYTAIPDSYATKKVCTNCLNFFDPHCSVFKCVSCDNVKYCSEACQEMDMKKFHNLECCYLNKLITEDTPLGYTLDYQWLLIRTLIRYLTNDEEKGNYLSSTFKDVNLMCSNCECFDSEKLLEFRNIALSIKTFLDANTELKEKLKIHLMFYQFKKEESATIEKVFGKAYNEEANETDFKILSFLFILICKEECNSFGLYSFKLEGNKSPRQPFGLALFPLSVFFNHSCYPNVGYVTRNKSIIFYALMDINEGEMACISYVGIKDSLSKQERKENLKKYFFFNCECKKCSNEGGNMDEKITCHFDNACFGWMVPTKLVKDAKFNENEFVCEACLN
ncbi:hypothetical protein HDU92_007886 [Lobulomyces angularis]|nr:hypothetical protein HDU92_007886 [Lobulomyces angularis]